MKIGAENRSRVILMVVLLAIAIPLALYKFKGVFWGADASAAPSAAPAATQRARPGSVLPAQDGSDPRLRLDILDASRKVKYEAGGRNIFTMQEVNIEKPLGSVRGPIGPPAPPPPTPTPTPVPFPIKYYGFANKPGETRKIFLQQEGVGQIFVASQGDIVARRYRVVRIAPNSITMEDVLTGNQQDIRLTPR